jgi:hypothetical protein
MTNGKNDSTFDLRSSGFVELLRRSLHRLFHTGRYVPASVIWDMRSRTDTLIQSGIREALNQRQRQELQRPHMERKDQVPLSKLDFHQGLSRLINFDMDDSRIVRPMNASPASGRRGTSGSSSSRAPSSVSNSFNTSPGVGVHQRPSFNGTTSLSHNRNRKRPLDR